MFGGRWIRFESRQHDVVVVVIMQRVMEWVAVVVVVVISESVEVGELGGERVLAETRVRGEGGGHDDGGGEVRNYK